jgi:hypothetical protein
MMANIADIIRLWPRPIDLARELAVGPSRITDWKNRNAIPVAYWQSILQPVHRRGHPEVTAELLVELHAREPAAVPQGLGEEEKPGWRKRARRPEGDAEREATGHFSRFKHLRRANFASAEEITANISALRDEWEPR